MIGKLGLAVASLGCDKPERRYDHVAFYRMLVYFSHLTFEVCESTRHTHLLSTFTMRWCRTCPYAVIYMQGRTMLSAQDHLSILWQCLNVVLTLWDTRVLQRWQWTPFNAFNVTESQ